MKTTTEINHSERAHALCSASGAERWLNCPGSVALCLKVPEGAPSPYALEGTKFHELCEKMLEPLIFHYNKDHSLSVKLIAEMLDDLPGTFISSYPLEMREHAQDYIGEIWQLIGKHKPKKILIEKKMTLNKPLEMFGIADLLFAFKQKEKNILVIVDIKYGAGKTVEPDCPQLIYYALAAQETFPKIKFDESWLYIFQPRVEHEEGTFRKYVLKKREAAKWKATFLDGAKEALAIVKGKTEPKFVAGDHCQFCSAKPVCVAHAKYIDAQAGIDFTDDPAVLVPAVSDQRFEIREFMSDEQISRLLLYRKEIEKFLSSLVEYAINRSLEGDPINGWKVVEARSQRKWDTDNGTDIAKELAKLGIKDPWDKKLRGLGSIEKELKTLGVENKKGAAIAHLTTKTTPGKTLVPDTDSRPAIDASTTAGSDFEEIDA